MDKPSNQALDFLAMKKQLSLYLMGSSMLYQNYKRTQQMSNFYPNDFHYYNDTFYYRHERNIQQIRKLKDLLRKQIIRPQMLIYNTWNTFYPSYVMNHHFGVYLEILKLFSQDSNVAKTYQKARNLDQLGFYVNKIVNVDFGKCTNDYQPTLSNDGKIKMNKQYFFFDKHVSLYAHNCCFLAKKGNDNVLLFVKLRNQNGQLLKQVTVKDFGQRISSEYLQIAYNFDEVQPFLAIKLSNEMKILSISNMSYFYQFNLSLLQLKKCLYLAINYTKMRVQFATLPQSKSQRAILTYQAVGSRVINGFCKYICFSELNRALLNNPQIIPFAAGLLEVNHHLILEAVIRMRECCGGFGFLQVAGFGGSVERLAQRASQAIYPDVPQNTEILKRLHYYSSSDDMEQFFGQMFNKEDAFNPTRIFVVFVNICVNMRKASSKMKKQQYLRHFMYQACIQILKTTQQFSRLPRDSLPFLALFYECACYIIQNSSFINWQLIQSHISKQQYFIGLQEFKNNYLNQLIKKVGLIQEIIQVSHVRNVVVGRDNKQQFYQEVLKTARDNLRNSQDFNQYVKRPIVEFLVQNNQSKL